jgi:hypothetical protein
MTITNGYVTTAEARRYVGQNDNIDTTDLDEVITAVSRMIDAYCRRHFFQSTEARTFQPDDYLMLTLGANNDLVSVTSITIDEEGDGTYGKTLVSTEYQLQPTNRTAPEPVPVTMIRALGVFEWPVPLIDQDQLDRVKITGVWGWPAVPAAVKRACLLQTARIARRQESPLGVAGFGEFGAIRVSSQPDPDLRAMLAPYRILDGFAG